MKNTLHKVSLLFVFVGALGLIDFISIIILRGWEPSALFRNGVVGLIFSIFFAIPVIGIVLQSFYLILPYIWFLLLAVGLYLYSQNKRSKNSIAHISNTQENQKQSTTIVIKIISFLIIIVTLYYILDSSNVIF